MTADLAASCDAIAAWLPVARALLAEPDTDGCMPKRPDHSTGSAAPWNPAVAIALMDAHEGIPRLEASLRVAVTGHPGPRRGGSDANTMAAIVAIGALAYGLPLRHVYEYDANGRRKPCRCPHCCAVRILDRWVNAIRQLPAIDEVEPWIRVPAECHHCHFGMMRMQVRAGRVTCLRVGVCADHQGNHPTGLVQRSVSGAPMVAWDDGCIQYGDMT